MLACWPGWQCSQPCLGMNEDQGNVHLVINSNSHVNNTSDELEGAEFQGMVCWLANLGSLLGAGHQKLPSKEGDFLTF